MNTQTTSPEKILRLAVWCALVSSSAAAAFLLFRHSASVRGPAAGVGIMAAFIGSGVAGWFAFRAHDRRLVPVAVVSALPLVFWSWVLYGFVHVNAT